MRSQKPEQEQFPVRHELYHVQYIQGRVPAFPYLTWDWCAPKWAKAPGK